MSSVLLAKIHAVKFRLNVVQFFRFSVWLVACTLVVAAFAVAASQMFVLAWNPWWIGSSAIAVGIISALIAAVVYRRTDADAAAEMDAAFGLKERITTLLMLSPQQAETPAGVALREDVETRTSQLPMHDRMKITAPHFSWAPAVPLALLVGAAFLSPFENRKAAAKSVLTAEQRKEVAAKTDDLAKKLAERREKQKLSDPEISKDLKSLTNEIETLAMDLSKNKEMKKEEAVLKLADLSKSMEERRKQYDNLDNMKSALSKMPNFKDGPADKISSALKAGDFKTAAQELKKLQEKASQNKMSSAEKKKLGEQLNQLQKSMKELANLSKREAELKKNIKDSKQLEKALAALGEDKKKLEMMQKIAEKLSQCSQCAGGKDETSKSQSGGQQPSSMSTASSEMLAKEMKEAAEMLEQMASSDSTREMLNEMLNDLSETRTSMMGGRSMSKDINKGRSMYNKGGVGQGARDESPDDVKSRLTKAQIEKNKGQVFAVGLGDGKNIKGSSTLTFKDIATANAGKATDESVTRQKVPREYEDHTREYFELLEKAAK